MYNSRQNKANKLKNLRSDRLNFRERNLRGISFVNRSLVGAKFNGADIRGSDFTGANLSGADFSNVIAGTQPSYYVVQIIISVVLLILSGVAAGHASSIASWGFSGDLEAYDSMPRIILRSSFLILSFIILRKGLNVALALTTLSIIIIFIVVTLVAPLFGEEITTVSNLIIWRAAGTMAWIISSILMAIFPATVLKYRNISFYLGVIFACTGTVGLAFVETLEPYNSHWTKMGTWVAALWFNFLSGDIARKAFNGSQELDWVGRSCIVFCSVGGTSFSGADLTGAIFHSTALQDTDFRDSNLIKTDFHSSKYLDRLRYGKTILFQKKVRELLSSRDYQYDSYRGVNLRGANLSNADLSGIDLMDADLSYSSFENTLLVDANLARVNAVGTNFEEADLTGACIQAWNTDYNTRLDNVKCKYIFLKNGKNERRPSAKNVYFSTGEFAALFQKARETVDLIFQDGIDWKSFFNSYQKLQEKYREEDFFVQGIERKGDAFVVRLQVGSEVDKSKIESSMKQFYEEKVKELVDEKTGLIDIIKTMADKQGQTINLPNAQIAGGFAGTVQGNQTGGVINNYDRSENYFAPLLTTLRDLTELFPQEQREDALLALEDLENDLNKHDIDSQRLARRVKRLIAISTTVAAVASGAANFSGNIKDFTDNIFKLTETLGLPMDILHIDPPTPSDIP